MAGVAASHVSHTFPLRVLAVLLLVQSTRAQDFCSPKNISADDAPCHGFDCLKQYCDKADANYKWEDTGNRLHGTHPAGHNWTGYVINMTSQSWLHIKHVPALTQLRSGLSVAAFKKSAACGNIVGRGLPRRWVVGSVTPCHLEYSSVARFK